MERPKLRIVHTMSSFMGGGMEHFVLRLAEAQRKRGHQASIVSVKGGPLHEQARALGVPARVLEGAGGMGGRILRDVFAMGALFRPDVVHAHNPTSLHYATIGKLCTGARLVMTDHAATRGIARIPSHLEWRLTDAVVAVSADTAGKSRDIGFEGVPEVIHNGIDLEPARRSRADVRAELGLGDEVVGVNVAGFVPVKAQDVLVRALGALKNRGTRLTVLTVGDGPERRSVERLAESLGLGPREVRFLGFRTDVVDLLAASDFFVLPSRMEGFPLSVLEAMSQRLAVVATPVGGNPELVTDGAHGLLVAVDDDRALADAMAALAADPARRIAMGEAGHARVRDEFSFERMTDRYEAVYQRVLGGRRIPGCRVKVLLLTEHYPRLGSPTRGTYNRNAFGALARHCEARVVGPIAWWTRTRRPRDMLRVVRDSSFGVDAAFLSYWSLPGATSLHGRAAFASLYPYLRWIRREFPYDIILASWAYPDGVAASHLAELDDVPLVINVLGSDINELPRMSGLRPQIQRALRRAQRVVPVSRDLGERVVELGVPRDRVTALHNGVDGAEFVLRDKMEARRRLGIEHAGPLVVYVGNLKVSKGAKVLVEAMDPLVRRLGREDAQLVVVGGGEDREIVAARIAELGLAAHVRLAGLQLHADIPWFVSACDVFCLPSYMEGCPNVVLEALAAGRPVVASRVGGIPELVSEKTGVLVPPRDAEALARGLDEALGRTWDPEAQRASVPHLSWDSVGDAYRDILTMVLDEWRDGKR